MSKAEDLALKAYPKMSRISEHHSVIPADNKSHYLGDANAEKREGFIEGYRQAEKDLELTWEDMMIIHKCIKDATNFHLYKMMEGIEGQKVVYKEVLKRFKERKEK